ncbi:MAG TPA: phosphotransferase [Streptosporangiaceae bacterium]|nr:phosphotransferase [Streptosporangiaceae bacterium]
MTWPAAPPSRSRRSAAPRTGTPGSAASPPRPAAPRAAAGPPPSPPAAASRPARCSRRSRRGWTAIRSRPSPERRATIGRMSTPRPAGPGPRRLHLDLHPLNLLVSDDGELTGVLDGPNAAAGHPDLDRARTWSILTLDPIARSYRSQPVFAALAEAWLEQGQLARASPAARGRSPTPPGRAASARSNTRPALPARQPPAGAAPRPPASPLTCALAGRAYGWGLGTSRPAPAVRPRSVCDG